MFLLKEYCGLSLFEQRVMTAEERVWYLERYNEEMKKKNDSQNKTKGARTPRMSKPSMPSVRR